MEVFIISESVCKFPAMAVCRFPRDFRVASRRQSATSASHVSPEFSCIATIFDHTVGLGESIENEEEEVRAVWINRTGFRPSLLRQTMRRVLRASLF